MKDTKINNNISLSRANASAQPPQNTPKDNFANGIYITKLSQKRFCENFLSVIYDINIEQQVIIYSQELLNTVNFLIATLTADEATAVMLLCDQDKTVEEAADVLGVSAKRGKEILKDAYRKLRHPIRSSKILPFVILLENDLDRRIVV